MITVIIIIMIILIIIILITVIPTSFAQTVYECVF